VRVSSDRDALEAIHATTLALWQMFESGYMPDRVPKQMVLSALSVIEHHAADALAQLEAPSADGEVAPQPEESVIIRS
jgi:hypothetical protein